MARNRSGSRALHAGRPLTWVASGLVFLAAGCSAGVTDSDNVAVVSGSSNAMATAPRPTPGSTATPPSALASAPSGPKLVMPLPRYVPAPPLSPALQAAEDDIKQATQSLTDRQQNGARDQPPAT